MKYRALVAFELMTLALLASGASARAAQPDPAAFDPAVQTSPASRPAVSQPAAPAAKAPAATQPAAAPAPAPGAKPAASTAAPRTNAAAAPGGSRARDRLELETTQITGNRELPRVMYVVPWKKSDLGDLGGRPANSLLDEVLTPVDRDVFLRQNRYYDALKPDAREATGAAPAN